MGAVGEKRLNSAAPFTSSQTDLIGPMAIKEYKNSRGTRKLWLMVCICNFTRYISLTPVESLSKESILNAFESHFHRFGRSQSIETDMGSNFSSAKQDLETAEAIDPTTMKEVAQELKSTGVQLIQRAAKAAFIQGSVERSNQIVKRIFPEKRLTVFQLLNVVEFIMYVINRRPIGNSSTLECVRPADVIPIWSKLQPSESLMRNCSQVIADALREFRRKWEQLYMSCVLRQKKWMTSNHTLEVGDLVLITDLLGHLNYPRHGKITAVEPDSTGIIRYFHIEYKNGKRTSSVKRTAQSLTLVLKKLEDEQAQTMDTLFFYQNDKDFRDTKKIKGATDQIIDL